MKTKVILARLILCTMILLFALPFAAPRSHAQARLGQVVSSGEAVARKGTVQPKGPLKSSTFKTPPDAQPQRPPKPPEQRVRLDPPVDPSARPEDIRPMNAETTVRVVADPTKPTAPQAPGDFAFYRNTNTGLASAPVVGGVPLNAYIPIEPSVGANGRVVFYTTNSYAAVSGDSGQTFTYLNPFDNFPADGTNDAVNGLFGGDQYIYYERTRGLTFWLLQYNPDNATNTQRLCIARSQADVLNNNWYFYDFTPADFGFTTPPAGANGFWLDFPDMAVSDNFLYLTSNVFQRVLPTPGPPPVGNNCQACPNQNCPPATCPGGCTPNCVSAGAVIWRMPLNELAQGGFLNFLFYSDTNFAYRLTQGARGTMYWGSHNTTAQIRIYRWAENSGSIAFDNVTHAAYNVGTFAAASPDGTDFSAASDSRIEAAWVAQGVIGFMWNAAQGGGFAFPHVEVLRFNEGDRSLLPQGQGQVFNASHAFLHPSVHPNDRGHLGGTMAWGGGAFFPNALVWIADDFNNGTITPLENVTFAVGNAGPCDPAFDPIPANMTLDCYNRWGDYFATRVHRPSGLTWIGTGFVLNGTNGVTRDPRYVWFGRERDTPPPTNTIYVDLANQSRYEDGSTAHPYNTVTEGNFACSAGDTLIIRAGNYNETGRFNRAATVRNEGGIVRIGIP